MVGGQRVFSTSKEKQQIAAEIAKRFMLEKGLIFEDYLINSVAGNIEELFSLNLNNFINFNLFLVYI